MKIGLALMFVRPLPYKPEILDWIGQYADEFGYESLWVPEHIVIPANYQTAYPYNQETNKLPNNDETDTWPNPMVVLGYLAAVTKKARLGTCITILPLHSPIEMATQWAALDVLCNGRSIFGIGSGWLKEEFDALQIDWHQRGARTDESMQAMRVLWREDPSTFKGKHFSFEKLRCFPKPVQKSIPIFVGGNSKAAARRAARLGDGFFPVGEPHELVASFKEMEAECARIGRHPGSIERFVGGGNPAGFDPARTRDTIKRYADMGVTRTLLPVAYLGWQFTKEGLKQGMGKIMEQIGQGQ
jgi:probable F420-dependent oxidoreductase